MPVQLFSERIASKAIAKLFSGSNARILRFRTKLHGIETFFYMKADHFHCPSFYCTSLQLHHPLFCMTAFCTCKLNSKVYFRILDCVKQMSSTASAFSKQIVAASDTTNIRP